MKKYMFVILPFLINPAMAMTEVKTPDITCDGDRVVWGNHLTHVYHYEGAKWYGNTADGEFMCEKDAKKEGMRAPHWDKPATKESQNPSDEN